MNTIFQKLISSMIVKAFLIALISISVEARAELTCIDYSGNGIVKAALNRADQAQVDVAKKQIGSFVAIAKKGNQNEILELYSKKDGSFNELNDSFKSRPSLLAAYAKIDDWNIKDVFKWGNYLLLWTEYKHDNHTTMLLDALYCERADLCKISVQFDKSSPEKDFVSRFMSHVKVNSKTSSCGNKTNSFEIFENNVKVNPLVAFVEIQKPITLKNKSELLTIAKDKLDSPNVNCIDLSVAFDINKPDSIDNQNLYKKIISDCAINLTDGSGIPVVKLTGKIAQKIHVTPAVLISDFQRTTQVDIINIFNDRGRVNFIALLKLSNDEKRLYLIPSFNGGRQLLDWSYYGTGAAEIIVSEQFASYLNTLNIK